MLSLQVTGVVWREGEREREAGTQGEAARGDGEEGVDAQVVQALLKQLRKAQVNIKKAL